MSSPPAGWAWGSNCLHRLFLKVDAGLCALAGGNGTNELWQTFGVSLDYRFNRGLLGSLSSAPSTNGATCSNQAAVAAPPSRHGSGDSTSIAPGDSDGRSANA